MSSVRNFPVSPDFDVHALVHLTAQNLAAQGYQCQSNPISPQAVMLTVTKDREGFTDIIGMGLECKVTFTVINGTQLTVNIDSEWTNKIIAIAVGWFCCFIPFVTGIIGVVNQSELPNKIFTAVNLSLASGQGGQPYGYNNYNNFNQPPQ